MGELSTALAFSDLRLDKVAVKADVEIAVIVPVFRHSVFLADAVISALEQEIAHAIRIVIVNDGCPHNETHRTALTLAAAYPDRIDYVRRANGGLSAARNTGVDYALSRWPSIRALYFLDADNIIEPAALARSYTALMADETVGWVYPDIVMFGSAERHWDYSGTYSALQHLTVNVAEAGSLVRSELFRQGCRFDKSMKLGFEDWEFWWQGIAAGFVGKSIPFFGFRYRKRPESMLSETERDRASVVSYMRQKHHASLRPKSLLALENREAPRFALLHDADRVDILTDIRTIVEHVTIETIIADLAAASQQPELHHSSRFIVAASDSVLQLLTGLRLDRYVLWWLECEVSFDTDTQVAALQVVPGLEGSGVKIAKMDHSYWQRRDGPLHMMVWGDTTLAACLEDPRDDWILSLLRGKTEPRTAVLRIEVAAELLGEMRCPEVLYRYFDFFKSLHGARQLADPRFPVVKMRTIPPRAWTGNIPRTILECGPLFPLLEDDGRDIAFVLPILSHGGVEKVALRIAKEFQRRGFRLHLVVLSERASLNEEWLSVFEDVCFLYDPTFNIWPDGLSEQPQYLGTAASQWMVEGDSPVA